MAAPTPSSRNANSGAEIVCANAALNRAVHMFIDQIEAAIACASSTVLVELNRVIWQGLGSGALTEEDAGRLAEAIHARQTAAKAVQATPRAKACLAGIFPPRRLQRPPERSVAIERRRRLAASGPLPPALAARFTTSEAAVMRIVGDECRDKGRCVLPIDAIAARAGVGRTTVQNALRLARHLGMVEIEERRQRAAKNLPNRVTVVDREWRQWLDRGPRRHPPTGFKNLSTTETGFLTNSEAAVRLAPTAAGKGTEEASFLYRRPPLSRPS